MSPGLAKDLDHQVGEAVHHFELVSKPIGGIDHPKHLYYAFDVIEAKGQEGAAGAFS